MSRSSGRECWREVLPDLIAFRPPTRWTYTYGTASFFPAALDLASLFVSAGYASAECQVWHDQ